MSIQLIPYRYPDPVEYRPIQGWPGYRVGNDGTVWSCREKISIGYRLGTRSRLGEVWRLLKPGRDKYQREIVVLNNDGMRKTLKVHRLVLEAFVGPCPDGLEGCHSDGNAGNNSAVNLRWDTKANNHADKALHGTLPRGERGPGAKLNEAAVMEIRQRNPDGIADRIMVAEMFDVCETTIRDILQRKTWTEL